MSARAGLLFAVALALATAACNREPESAGAVAPPSLRATWVLEPPRVRVGDVATLELAAVTPPGHRVLPPRLPEVLPGFWLLELGLPELERATGHWLHRTRVRLRAREPGLHVWPRLLLEVESPEGELASLEVPGRTFEVVSVLDPTSGAEPPHGLLAPAEPDSGGSRLRAFGAGVATTLAGVAGVWLARRRRRKARSADPRQPAATPPAPPWIGAQREIETALALLPGQPARAAEVGAGALRRYVAHRFGLPAQAWTDPEFAAARPPLAGAAAWPRITALVAELDAIRFAPSGDAPSERVRSALEDARSLVAETRSREPHALVEQRAPRP